MVSTWKAPSCVETGASTPASAAPSRTAGVATATAIRSNGQRHGYRQAHVSRRDVRVKTLAGLPGDEVNGVTWPAVTLRGDLAVQNLPCLPRSARDVSEVPTHGGAPQRKAVVATPTSARSTTRPVARSGGALSALHHTVRTAMAASPLSGARLSGTRGARLTARPDATARQTNNSPVNMCFGLDLSRSSRPDHQWHTFG